MSKMAVKVLGRPNNSFNITVYIETCKTATMVGYVFYMHYFKMSLQWLMQV